MTSDAQNEAGHPGRAVFGAMDGVRGVAAICVMLSHFALSTGDGGALFASGYFAVDIFYGLSGFVICYSYEDRLRAGLPALDFFKLRLIRLYPVYAAGLALGACHLFGESYFGEVDNTWAATLSVIGSGLLFLPYGGKFQIGHDGGATDNALFPLNMPSWSLFFELFANASYAVFRPRGKVLIFVLSASLLLLALDAPPSSSAIQFPRVLFGFYLGVALCTLWRQGILRVPQWTVILAPAAVIVLCSLQLNGLSYMIALTLGVPLIVSLSVATPGSAFLRGLFRRLGEISYPLYVLHLPAYSLMRLTTNWVTGSALATEPSSLSKWLLALGLVLICPYLARAFDAPLRRWLRLVIFRPAAPRVVVAPRA